MRPGDILSRIFDVPLAIMSTSSYRADAGTVQGTWTSRATSPRPRARSPGKVLLVDDLADTGHTLKAVIDRLRKQLCPHHRAAQRRDLDQGRVQLRPTTRSNSCPPTPGSTSPSRATTA
jgi:hypoxanthine phosphoribosyltransferase